MTQEKKICMLTDFTFMRPAHSLCGLVSDQVIALTRQGYDVDMVVRQGFTHDTSEFPRKFHANIIEAIPKIKMIDYKSLSDISEDHLKYAEDLAERLPDLLAPYRYVLTHDWVFTGWNLPFAEALRMSRDKTRNQRFFHWVHSVPSRFAEWWTLTRYGNNHRIVYPNKTDSLWVAGQFRCKENQIIPIPHIRDIRTLDEWEEDEWGIVDAYPSLMEAQVVQVYPASTDRLKAKRVKELIYIFKTLKDRGASVCLFIANQHATGKQRSEDIESYKRIARRCGLTGDEFIFSSDYKEGIYRGGMPRRVLRQIMKLGNLFVFPTREESFGLVLPEACLLGGVLPVLNKNLSCMFEVGGFKGLYVDFGSYTHPIKMKRSMDYYSIIADLILARMLEDDSIQAKTFHRRKYNLDEVFRKHYSPALAGSALWR